MKGTKMKDRFTMFRRGTMFYWEDRTTGQQKSLQTRDEAEAQRIIQAKNDSVKLPQMNLVMARTYLAAQDPKMITRTWADVMERFCNRSNDHTRMRHERVVRTPAAAPSTATAATISPPAWRLPGPSPSGLPPATRFISKISTSWTRRCGRWSTCSRII